MSKSLITTLDTELKKISDRATTLTEKKIEIENEIELLHQQSSAIRQTLRIFSKVTVGDSIYQIFATSQRSHFSVQDIVKELNHQDVLVKYGSVYGVLSKDSRFRKVGSGQFALVIDPEVEPTLVDQEEVEVGR